MNWKENKIEMNPNPLFYKQAENRQGIATKMEIELKLLNIC